MRRFFLYQFVLLIILFFSGSVFSGCASLRDKLSLGADETAQEFFNYLEKSDRQGAYDMFGKGLSQTVSFEQFDGLIDTFQEKWGSFESQETVTMPFHQREGEQNFIPLGVSEDQIKRYVFEVKFGQAQVNCDLTLVPDGNTYKIVWLSFWGSGVYMTPDITDKIQELFSKNTDS